MVSNTFDLNLVVFLKLSFINDLTHIQDSCKRLERP